MVVATLGLVISGVVEYYRKKELATSGGMVQNLGGKDYTASHMSVFLQVPQLLCSGISEVFIVVPGDTIRLLRGLNLLRRKNLCKL